MKIRSAVLCAAAVLLLATGIAVADDTAATARKVIKRYEGAIVKVQLVTQTQISMEGRETSKRENKTETTATIIDPSGLAVVSLSATDPTEALSSMGFGDDRGIDLRCQVTDAKFRMNDGKEIPAKIVLRDKDLDLAFIRPAQKQAQPFPYVDISKSTRPDRLDQILVLARMGKVANRTLSTCLDRVQAVVQKPRTFFVPGAASMMSDMGAPVFAMDGNPVGLLVLRTALRGDVDDGSFGMGNMGMMPMILPAADIMKVAKQAPEQTPKTANAPAAAQEPKTKAAK